MCVSYFNRNLSELMDRFVQDFKSLGVPMVEGDGSNVVFPSAGELFVFYKKCMVQCSQLSTGPPLLSLTAAFQKFLREYSTRVLNNHLPVKWVLDHFVILLAYWLSRRAWQEIFGSRLWHMGQHIKVRAKLLRDKWRAECITDLCWLLGHFL